MKKNASAPLLIVCAVLAFAAAALCIAAVLLSALPLGFTAAACAAASGTALLIFGRKDAPAQENAPAAPCAAAAPTLPEDGERCCPYCGKTLPPSALFCPACGAEQPWQLEKI